MIWLLSCEEGPAETPIFTGEPLQVESDAAYQPLPAPRLLRRMSLDLRGVLPSVAELDAVEADPSQLGVIRDQYLEDTLFEERLVQVLAETWHSRVDSFLIAWWEYEALGEQPTIEYPFERSVGEEPLRLMAYVASHDRPWSEVTTADYTMANEILASIWPIEHGGGEGWVQSHYTDGRPPAGVLSTNGLWWRYYTTLSNRNRGRAAAISRLLLCEDYLARPVSLAGNTALASADGLENALTSDPYCLGCHSSLDPVASTLFGFWGGEYSAVEQATYHPEREELGTLVVGAEPGFFGVPVSGLEELGWRISEDPRFEPCAAQSFAEAFWRRSVVVEDFSRINSFASVLHTNNQQIKPMLKSVTDSPVYQAGALNEEASAAQMEREALVRLLNAPLLASVLQDLTGFAWSYNGYDQLDNDTYGYRIMAGGVDGNEVSRPQKSPGMTWLVVLERAAYGAASQAMQQGYGQGLLARVSATTTPSDPAFTEALKELYWHFYAVRPDDSWLSSITTLWETVEQDAGPDAAWTALFAAMFQDPLFGSY
jgi:hypothetical protein